MTLLDLFAKPKLVEDAWKYFKEEQGMEQQYVPMVTETDKPAIYLNTDIMGKFKFHLKKYYYDETKYDTYLQQLGINYPTLKKE